LKKFGTVVDKLDEVENAVDTVGNDKEAETFRLLARRLATVTKKLVQAERLALLDRLAAESAKKDARDARRETAHFYNRLLMAKAKYLDAAKSASFKRAKTA
jgi:hypothetical protein